MNPTIKAAILTQRADILALAARYGVSDVRLFGSVARGDTDAASDVDFVVRFEPGRSLFDQGALLMAGGKGEYSYPCLRA